MPRDSCCIAFPTSTQTSHPNMQDPNILRWEAWEGLAGQKGDGERERELGVGKRSPQSRDSWGTRGWSLTQTMLFRFNSGCFPLHSGFFFMASLINSSPLSDNPAACFSSHEDGSLAYVPSCDFVISWASSIKLSLFRIQLTGLYLQTQLEPCEATVCPRLAGCPGTSALLGGSSHKLMEVDSRVTPGLLTA